MGKKEVDKMCCFKPKRVTNYQMRFEACADQKVFVMVRLANDPRVAPPFVHLNVSAYSDAFKRLTSWGIVKVKREVVPFVRDKFGRVIPNKEGHKKAAADRLEVVTAKPVGQNAL